MTDEQDAQVPAAQATESTSDDQKDADVTSPAPEQADAEQEKSGEPEQAAS